jgi:hypothetical protein
LVVIGGCVAQLIPVQRTNPPSHGELQIPPAISVVLKRACYDCHSNATRWPWYSRVAPVSWIVVRHVTEGRRQLNFSEWGSYYPRTQVRKLRWINRTVSNSEMPPWWYTIVHRDASLSIAERSSIEQWVSAQTDPGHAAESSR